MYRMLFGNLPGADLGSSIEFFSRLGFAFNHQFTDETANCMIAGEDNFFMLLTHEKFRSDTPGLGICDTGKSTQVLLCLSAESRAGVDALLDKAGGSSYREPENHGFIYGRAFRDLDGPIWEIMWMDAATRRINATHKEQVAGRSWQP